MIIAVLGILGVILGSFVNALVWRLHEQELLKGKKSKTSKNRLQELSISNGRSMCPHCGHTLAAKDLVPLFSWLQLRGKCRYCQKPISWQYPLVEALNGIVFAVSYACWPQVLHGMGVFQFALWLVFVTAFMALAVYDLRWFTLPDRIVYPITVLAAAQTLVVAIWDHSIHLAWEPVLAAAIIFGLFWTLYQISNGNWIGGGDVKLAITLGLLAARPAQAFLVIFFASLLGTFVSIPLLARGKEGMKMHIPFGPYLLVATFIVVLFGDTIANWYQNLFLM